MRLWQIPSLPFQFSLLVKPAWQLKLGKMTIIAFNGIWWCSSPSVSSDVIPIIPQQKAKLRKDDKERFDLKIYVQIVLTLVFTQEHIHYSHWLISHHPHSCLGAEAEGNSWGYDRCRTPLYSCIKFSTFPGACLKPGLQRGLEKVEISLPTPHPLTIYMGEKWSNVVHIIW